MDEPITFTYNPSIMPVVLRDELAFIGMAVSVMRQWDDAERQRVLAYLSAVFPTP